MNRRLLAAILASTLVCTGAALAQDSTPFAGLSQDTDKPIEISAETQQADFKAETVTYSGDVRIKQGNLTLRADKVEGTAPKGRISTIRATGDVVITSADATARCPTVVYDVAARRLHLSGGVVLTQGPNTVRGSDLVVDMQAGTAVLTSSGGRVDGVLQPNR